MTPLRACCNKCIAMKLGMRWAGNRDNVEDIAAVCDSGSWRAYLPWPPVPLLHKTLVAMLMPARG